MKNKKNDNINETNSKRFMSTRQDKLQNIIFDQTTKTKNGDIHLMNIEYDAANKCTDLIILYVI